MKTSAPKSSVKAAQGHTEADIVTLPDGTRGVFKPYDKLDRSQFQLSEVAAYEVDRLFDFNIVPVTVDRVMFGKWGSFQYFVPDSKVGFDVGIYHRSDRAPLFATFDYLIHNQDPIGMNLLVTKEGKRVAIDHDFCFLNMEVSYELEMKLKSKIHSITTPEILRKLKAVKDSEIRSKMFNILPPDKIEALIARKNLLLKVSKEVN